MKAAQLLFLWLFILNYKQFAPVSNTYIVGKGLASVMQAKDGQCLTFGSKCVNAVSHVDLFM